MFRRLLLFGFGALIGIFFISIMDNDIKKGFKSFQKYPDSDHRIKKQFELSDTRLYHGYDSVEITLFLETAWVNYEDSKNHKDDYPKIYILDNIIDGQNQRLICEFYDRKISADTSKNFSRTEFVKLEKNIPISSRSYMSQYIFLAIILIIMIPVIFLIRRKFINKV